MLAFRVFGCVLVGVSADSALVGGFIAFGGCARLGVALAFRPRLGEDTPSPIIF